MAKKNLKRGLALGALMAFVITGSAMAADSPVTYRGKEQSTILDGFTSTIVTDASEACVPLDVRGTGVNDICTVDILSLIHI